MSVEQPENKAAIREIFLKALETQAPAERAAYLQGACGKDAALRAKVDALLSGHENDSFLESPAVEVSESAVVTQEPLTEGPGTVIGRYKLREKIGEGGFGIVYLAEQREPVKRRVALKIIKVGMDTREVVARFEAERQALAMMDHPNIAKVHDGGTTDTGRLYFVMELVRGVPITLYCDENQLPTCERLRLFVQVCQAVQHAHQKGIIHRDLKPSNILVTVNDGLAVPKIIDFGIAKATQMELTDKTVFTRFQQFLGTPAYMSPEQAEMTSLDIDTRSDIYSLGVLLYELLTGKTPFDANELLQAGLDEMRRTIREKEPMRPSTKLTRERAAQGLGSAKSEIRNPKSDIDQDLDWIVMKCLEKDRVRRYETANGLASDIQRHLNNEPVVARPPSAAYRFQKFIRRNKIEVAAVSIVLTALLVAVIVSTWQAVLARRSERKARAVTDFLVDELLKTNPFSQSQADPAREAFTERVSRALDGRFTNDPLIEAQLRMALGMGFINNSRGLVEFEKALAIRQRLLGAGHPDTLAAAAGLAWRYLEVGRRSDAKRLLTSALTVVRKSPGRLSPGAAEVLFSQGVLLRMEDRPADALPLMEEALSVLSRNANPKDWRHMVRMGHFAFAATDAGKTAQAEKLWNELEQQCERELGPNNPMTAQSLMGKAMFLVEQGRWQSARQLFERAIPILKDVAVETNNFPLLNCEEGLARCYEQSGDIQAAAKAYLNIYPRLTNRLSYQLISQHCRYIANFFVRQHDYSQARQLFAPLEEWFTKNPPETGWEFEIFLAATGATKGWAAAAEVCRANLNRFSDSLWIWLNKAWIFQYVGDQDAYNQVVTHVLGLAQRTNTRDHAPIEIAALGTFDFSYEQLAQLQGLIRLLESSLPQSRGDQQGWGYRAIAHFQLRRQNYNESLAALENSISKQANPDSYTLFIKAACLHRLGESAKARTLFDEAVSLSNSQLPQPIAESENFLTPAQLYQHLAMRRETQAVLTSSQTKP